MKPDRPPVPMVVLNGGKLTPCTAFDAQELSAFPNGMMFDIIARNKRTLPLHRTYWKALTNTVEATGRWPSREALHICLKVQQGLVQPIYDMSGNVSGMIPDSSAFSAMDQGQFKIYFNTAMATLSEAVGYDALSWLND